jgi:hypothetical protein
MIVASGLIAGPAMAQVTLTASKADVLFSSDDQHECGALARLADPDLPSHVVRLRVDDPSGTADTFRWSLPKPNVGFFLQDNPDLVSSVAGAFAIQGFCSDFGTACLLTKEALRAYNRPTVLWAGPTCASLPSNTRTQFGGDTVRVRVKVKGGGRSLGKASTTFTYGALGSPVLFVENQGGDMEDGIGKKEVNTGVGLPLFAAVVDPGLLADLPSPPEQYVFENGEGDREATDMCPFPNAPEGSQACTRLQYESAGRFVATLSVNLEDGAAICDKVRTKIGTCIGRPKLKVIRKPSPDRYKSGDVADVTVRMINASPKENGCRFIFTADILSCMADFKLGTLEESRSTNFQLPNCKEDGLVCENDFQCGANGPCLTESHCSETTTQLCTADNDCSLSLCPTCQPDERCDRILDVGLDLLFRGLNPGESVDLLQETVELKNILKGTAKIRETWTGNTFNAGSASDSIRYRIKGVPLQ